MTTEICPTCHQEIRQPNLEQATLLEMKPIEGVLDMTAGLHGMQYEVGILASINLDASPYRKVTLRGDFRKLPFRSDTFDWILFDPPHTIDARNTLLGTMSAQGGLGPHIGVFKYGCYHSLKDLRESVYRGAQEAYRVLKVGGTMIFKWSNSEKPYSWATDTVEKAGFERDGRHKYKVDARKSGAGTGNFSFYVWYRK